MLVWLSWLVRELLLPACYCSQRWSYRHMQPCPAFYTCAGDSNSVSQKKLSYPLGHLLSLSFHQTFIKPQCCGGRWLSGTREQSGTKNHACPRDLLRSVFPLLLFTVLVTISTHFNLLVFNASVYFLMNPPGPPLTGLCCLAK